MSISKRFCLASLPGLSCFALTLASVAGCSDGLPPLGKVGGLVTLDGRPLAGADVFFVPVGGGIQSYGCTDAKGRYRLSYSGRKGPGAGAILGRHRVMISAGNPQAGNEAVAPPPILPSRYNTQTTLAAEVKPGYNDLDFPLQSGDSKR
jgi:hypothetical protein